MGCCEMGHSRFLLMSRRTATVHTMGNDMKASKVLILAFGVLGLLGLIIPSGGMSLLGLLMRFNKVQGMLCLIVFAVPIIMGLLALAKPPMLTWQAGLSLAAFGLGVLKFRPWQMLSSINFQGGAIAVGVIGGIVASIMALTKREA